jgi:hypothetical protein
MLMSESVTFIENYEKIREFFVVFVVGFLDTVVVRSDYDNK